jgi:isoleucyl-tRNA synthetase
MWVATVEFWKDVSIGPTILAHVAESMRKIRNSARFMLGNLGDGCGYATNVSVDRSTLSLVSYYRY